MTTNGVGTDETAREFETNDPARELQTNDPATRAEVTAAFARYEAALAAGDLAELAASFADHPDVVRFGVADRQRGPAELALWRAAQPQQPPGRSLFETTVTTYGSTFAVVTTLFSYAQRPTLGRQSQTWVRGPHGWQIVHAHVSEISA
jgi:ketosteroid isomerase-like protein